MSETQWKYVPLLIDADINKIKSTFDEKSKPTIVLFGDSGVGKTSFLRTILKKQNINEHDGLVVSDNSEGTKDFVGFDDNFCVWVDARGKRSGESTLEFVDICASLVGKEITIYLGETRETRKIKRVDFVLLIFLAQNRDNARNTGESSDIYCYKSVMKAFTDKFHTPFLILFNKIDLVESQSVLEDRIGYCDRIFRFAPPSWYSWLHLKNLRVGIEQIASSPVVRTLKTTCPEDPDPDDEENSHRYKIKDGCRVSICHTCHTFRKLTERDDWELLKKYPTYNQLSAPTTAPQNIDRPIQIVLENCESTLSAVHIAKSASSSLDERFLKCPILIKRIIRHASIWDDGPKVDVDLCNSLALLFDLNWTSIIASKYEKDLWQLERASSMEKLGRRIWNTEKDHVQSFLTAWGIYYSRKFYMLIQLSLMNVGKEKMEDMNERERKKIQEIYLPLLSTKTLEYGLKELLKDLPTYTSNA